MSEQSDRVFQAALHPRANLFVAYLSGRLEHNSEAMKAVDNALTEWLRSEEAKANREAKANV